MARYIDADKMRSFIEVDKYGHINTTITKLNIAIEKSRADVQEVRHGKWLFEGTIENTWKVFTCSECGGNCIDGGNYCPNCGAKLEE